MARLSQREPGHLQEVEMINGLHREKTCQNRHSWDNERIQQLCEEYQRTRSRDVKEEIFRESQGLASYYARKYAEHSFEYDDLYQEACLGILRAIERYDSSRGVKFSTYAARFAEGNIRQYFRDRSWPCYVPRKTKGHAYRIRRLSNELGHDLSRQEIVEYAEVPPDEVDDAILASNLWNRTSIYSKDSGAELVHEADLATACTDEELEAVPVRVYAQDIVRRSLTPFEESVVRLHFYEGLSQREIAERLGTYQMMVSRTLRIALAKMRDAAGES